MYELSLSAIGTDRPGIVAAMTGVLAELGCSIEDSEMAVLRNNFAMMLVLSAPERTSATMVESALAPVASRFELVVAVRPLAAPASGSIPAKPVSGPGTAEPGQTVSLSVHGADRPGIVAAVSGSLAEEGANIVELRTHVAGEAANPLYVMVMEAILPAGADLATLGERLDSVARDMAITVTITPVEGEVF